MIKVDPPEVMIHFQVPENTLILRETGYNVYRGTGEEVHGYVDQHNRYYELTEYPDGTQEWMVQDDEVKDEVGVPPYAEVGDLVFAEGNGVQFYSLMGLMDEIK